MATIRISDYQFIQELEKVSQAYFTMADLEKIFNRSRKSLTVSIHRLVKRGALVRLSRGIFQTKSQTAQLEHVANQMYYPSYLSFESALARHGILSQQPYALTFATTKRSKKLLLGDQEVQFRQLDQKYYFGYTQTPLGALAEPEKAIIDQLYLVDRGLAYSEVGEWSLVGISTEKLLSYAQAFSKSLQRRVEALERYYMIPFAHNNVCIVK
ncbi:MAG: hypothetical protein GW947_03230 [Candidatus Pacebacteria bacterium]|nr:hypothetical protein [Candidatus Paceibacterota bacterium]PIR59749.1 MAG: hypothetical protein COU68_03885 [Candidatus Pacebacteria bacterium CG10_big_fil_rev_8_21_14_0_10_45_6]